MRGDPGVLRLSWIPHSRPKARGGCLDETEGERDVIVVVGLAYFCSIILKSDYFTGQPFLNYAGNVY